MEDVKMKYERLLEEAKESMPENIAGSNNASSVRRQLELQLELYRLKRQCSEIINHLYKVSLEKYEQAYPLLDDALATTEEQVDKVEKLLHDYKLGNRKESDEDFYKLLAEWGLDPRAIVLGGLVGLNEIEYFLKAKDHWYSV